ncbi:MAG: hypothetical protein GF375_03800 [Candidatus Omnitrophica bacterium]|nr:hypothetical protein [Candidatus Omnitrophota bacterium]MBD3269184.1 hypothetical protein [Candidatus Omnitrophota bacterium]
MSCLIFWKKKVSKSTSAKTDVLKNIKIVLVQPRIAENIGLVARVLHNTSFSPPVIVTSGIEEKAFKVARRSRHFVGRAQKHDKLKDAVGNSHFIFGTTCRPRENKPVFDFDRIKHLIVSLACNQKVSILFGKENFGLSRSESELCDSFFYIPASPDFSSYNLSHAVAIVCYEIFTMVRNMHSLASLELASSKEYEELLSYMEEFITDKLKSSHLKPAITTLRRIFSRTHLTPNEIGLLKSLFVKPKPGK